MVDVPRREVQSATWVLRQEDGYLVPVMAAQQASATQPRLKSSWGERGEGEGMESVVFEGVAATRPKRNRSGIVREICMPAIWKFGLEFEACGFRC
jgi:hypothetical protein